MKILHVEIQRHGVAAEVHLNGWPLHHCERHGLVRAVIAAEEFAIHGDNTLTLCVEPNPTPTRWREPHDITAPADAWAIARATLYPPDVFPEPENGDVLATVTWRVGAAPPRFPAIDSASFRRAGARWSWESAPPLTPGPELVAEASRVLAHLRRAFDTQDLGLLERSLAVRIQDAMRAYPALTTAFVRDGLRSFLAALQRSPGGPSDPLRPSAHAMRLIAGGRALECLDADFLPSLRLRDEDGDPMPYPVRLARVDGQLQVIR